MTTDLYDGLTENERFNLPFLDALALETDLVATLEIPHKDLSIFRDELRYFSSALTPRILDAGCGWAHYAGDLADDFSYHGIDISENMLKAARERNPHLNFSRQSMGSTDFRDNRFHGIWSCCSLNTTRKRDLPRVLHEWRRILKRSGVLMVVMPMFGFSREELVGASPQVPEHYSVLWTQEEFGRALLDAGFQIASIHERPQSGAFSILARKG